MKIIMLINNTFKTKNKTITFVIVKLARSFSNSFFFLIPKKEFIILINHEII